MGEPLRVLLVEDSPDDAEILRRCLAREGLDPWLTRVESAADLGAALRDSRWDVVLADHHLPGFSSLCALEIVRASGLDLPFLIVSGMIGEDVAVEAMRAGADDYVLKRSLSRLVPAIRRATKEAEERRALRRAEEQIEWGRTHDGLTGLVDGCEMERLVGEALTASGAGDAPASFALVDLDGFRALNGALGRAAGDAILQGVAAAIRARLHPGDVAGRTGADEFGLFMPSCRAEDAMTRVRALVETISKLRFRWLSRALAVTASAGVVAIPGPGMRGDAVFREAGAACAAAKELGGKRVRLFDRCDAQVMRRWHEAEWVPGLLDAIDGDRFVLYVQKLRHLRGGSADGAVCEVLLRLEGEAGRLVPAGTFIPAAERFGLAPTIDRWVIEHVLGFLAARPRPSPVGPSLVLVNLSGASLGDAGFADDVERMFARSGCDPATVCLEVTETAVVRDLPAAVDLMSRLRRLGCRFALDDFGAGLSSLGYLRVLPVQFLKIDGLFIREMARDATARAIVESVRSLAHATGLETVAEWVEDPATLACVESAGLDYAQGFAIHVPEPMTSRRGHGDGA